MTPRKEIIDLLHAASQFVARAEIQGKHEQDRADAAALLPRIEAVLAAAGKPR